MYFLSLAAAAQAVDPDKPPHPDTMCSWHDKIAGPRDTNGRRIFTPQVCNRIRAARQAKRSARSAAR